MRLHQFFKDREASGKPLVLVTVFETAGSTYSKAGGQMIIDGTGSFCGMLSGGCLEGDLVERARVVIRTQVAEIVSYDLSADDELWGLGVGCDGTMRVLLQPLMPETGYQPFAAIDGILDGGEAAVVAIVISVDAGVTKAGASVVVRKGKAAHFSVSEEVASSIIAAADLEDLALARDVVTPDGVCRVLFTRITPSPSLLILGAGLDSEPVTRIVAELDWRCTVFDHRPSYIENRSYPGPTRTLCSPVEELSAKIELSRFDMALVMSHHLASDRCYLRQLSESDIAYIGLLGPPGRRGRLLDDLCDVAEKLQNRLRGPAGMELGGRGPGPIALEIVAEMQRFLSDRGDA